MSAPRVIRMEDHQGWGNNIAWWSNPAQKAGGRVHGRVYGHMTPKPQPGDVVACPMKSGRTALFEIRKKNYDSKIDPPDMFFADVKLIGYEGEKP